MKRRGPGPGPGGAGEGPGGWLWRAEGHGAFPPTFFGPAAANLCVSEFGKLVWGCGEGGSAQGCGRRDKGGVETRWSPPAPGLFSLRQVGCGEGGSAVFLQR